MRFAFALAALALTGCATASTPVASADGIARAGLNQRVYADGIWVTPLALVEDSRCPTDAQCIWAGRTRVMVRIDFGSHSEVGEVCSDEPLQVADGQLSLVEVGPALRVGQSPGRDNPYRFGFRFAGGL